MPISAYVIRFAPEDRVAVLERLTGLTGVSVGESAGDGVPVVADTRTTFEAEEAGERLRGLEGVRSATLVYHNFEDASGEAEDGVVKVKV